MNFRVGQKVVCVDDTKLAGYSVVKEGGVYTVDAIGTHRDGNTVLFLAEDSDNLFGVGHYARRFRPAVERKTDISIFTKMLTDTRINERV